MMGLAPAGYNSVLFDFDSLLDFKVGCTLVLKEFYSGSSYVDEEFLSMEDQHSLMQYHIGAGDPFKRSLKCLSDEDVKSLYEEIKRSPDYISFILDHSPITLMQRLLKNYRVNNIIKTKILLDTTGYTSEQDTYIEACTGYLKKKIDKECTLVKSPRSNENLVEFGRIISDTCAHIFDFGDMSAKSIMVLDYKENFTIIDKKVTLDPEFVLMYGDVNKLEYCTAFENLEMPLG